MSLKGLGSVSLLNKDLGIMIILHYYFKNTLTVLLRKAYKYLRFI